jgi:hypothetical protein
VLVAVGETLELPLVGREPLQPPDAMHEVASDEFQLNVVEPPALTVPGFAVNVTVGSGGHGVPPLASSGMSCVVEPGTAVVGTTQLSARLASINTVGS